MTDPKIPGPEPLVTDQEIDAALRRRRIVSPMEHAARIVLYRDPVVKALVLAARTEEDYPAWLARVLASVAAALGSLGALTATQPTSPGADLVRPAGQVGGTHR